MRTPGPFGRVKGTFSPSPRCGFSHQKYTDHNHVYQLCKNIVLYSSKQESLKASSTSALIGKKRKEATATEIRAYQKQFLEAKQLECKSWLDKEVFDLVDTRKIQVRNWVTGRWRLECLPYGIFLTLRATCNATHFLRDNPFMWHSCVRPRGP